MNVRNAAVIIATMSIAPMLAHAESAPAPPVANDRVQISNHATSARPALEILNTSDKTLYLLKRGKPVGSIEARSTFSVDDEFLKNPAILSWTASAPANTSLPHVSVRGFGSLCEANVCLIVK
ncbi:hypothetical protein [Pseudomonas faucium]|uniref:hypothetical protein n=1 Tax=Pseudomonas faucium TaxID=2740518 RepID=UPI0039C1357B